MEEDRAHRRIQLLCRHLLQQSDATPPVLLQVLLNGGRLLQSSETGDGDGEAVIIGGMVLDIHAVPSTPLVPGTTSPGMVYYFRGGVARNVAECMSNLSANPFLISALGRDMAGQLLFEHWKSTELPVEGIRRHEDIKTAVVCNTLDLHGELAGGVANVQDVERFVSAEWIQQFSHQIGSSPVLMVDANLSPAALEASCLLAAEYKVPVWFEPVSLTKSKRVAPIVKYVTYTSPNEDELLAMANELSTGNTITIPSTHIDKNMKKFSLESLFQILKPAIWVLLEKGIKVVLVTLGANGVLLCSQGGPGFMTTCSGNCSKFSSPRQLLNPIASSYPPRTFLNPGQSSEDSSHLFVLHIPALPATVKKLTGAGDCLVGGTLSCISAGLDLVQAVSFGIAVARVTVESEENVPSSFNLQKVTDDARSVYSAAKVLFHGPMR